MKRLFGIIKVYAIAILLIAGCGMMGVIIFSMAVTQLQHCAGH